MLSLKCALCSLKNQDGSHGLLSTLGTKIPILSKSAQQWCFKEINEIIKRFLLAGYKSIPEMPLRQPRLTYNACRPFTKNKRRIQKFKETGNLRYI